MEAVSNLVASTTELGLSPSQGPVPEWIRGKLTQPAYERGRPVATTRIVLMHQLSESSHGREIQ